MGYRGKLAEIATRLGVSKSSVSLWVRDVEFTPLPRPPRGRRREPNALQRRKQAEVERLAEEGRARIGRLSEREFLVAGVALYAGRGASGRGGEVRQQRPSDGHLLLRLASAVLRHRRDTTSIAAVSARSARSGCLTHLLVRVDRNPAVPVPEAVPRSSRSEHPALQACARLREHRLQLLGDPPPYHGARSRAPQRRRHSGVAQSAEQRPVKPLVASSSLAPGAASEDGIRSHTPQ
jgi:hypothetical protein